MKKLKKLSYSISLILFGLVILIGPKASFSLEKAPGKWPCDQVYNPKLNLTAIWQGPDIEENIKNWWKDDEVIDVAAKLSDPVLTEEEGIKIIDEFAKKHTHFGLISKKNQKQKLINLFSGLYQKASDKRIRQYNGIIKFVERQDVFRKAIGSASKKLRELRKKGVDIKNPEYVKFSSQMEWNTRVFDQRTRLTEYVCEEPVYLEQRIGYQARRILSYIVK